MSATGTFRPGTTADAAAEPVVEVFIEVPRGSFLKRDPNGRVHFVSPLPCPYNYGAVPAYLGGEGDLLDVVVLGPRLRFGTRRRLRVWGAITLTDRGESDDKSEDVLDRHRLCARERGQIITGRRSTSARIISNHVLPDPITIPGAQLDRRDAGGGEDLPDLLAAEDGPTGHPRRRARRGRRCGGPRPRRRRPRRPPPPDDRPRGSRCRRPSSGSGSRPSRRPRVPVRAGRVLHIAGDDLGRGGRRVRPPCARGGGSCSGCGAPPARGARGAVRRRIPTPVRSRRCPTGGWGSDPGLHAFPPE